MKNTSFDFCFYQEDDLLRMIRFCQDISPNLNLCSAIQVSSGSKETNHHSELFLFHTDKGDIRLCDLNDKSEESRERVLNRIFNALIYYKNDKRAIFNPIEKNPSRHDKCKYQNAFRFSKEKDSDFIVRIEPVQILIASS